MDLLVTLLLHPAIYLPIAALSFISFFINFYVLKRKREYSGINLKSALILTTLPGINLTFLLLNTIILSMAAGKYRIVKVKKYHKASVSKKKKGYSLGRI